MQPLMKSYTQVIKNKLYAQNPAPTQDSLDCLETLLFQDNFKYHKPLNDLMTLSLELGLTPYFKRYGQNVENSNFKTGDLIGIYFAKSVSLDINNSLFIRGKFCGFDLTEATVNLQFFATDKKADCEVVELAKKYELEEQIIRGSLRISLAHPKLSSLMAEFTEIVKSRT